ncbi:MAG TPA: ABC transporter permease [Thermomicrobiaceae bacterium]|nr:ABC transporter permease [Thermomicrobiaceae bacterium]
MSVQAQRADSITWDRATRGAVRSPWRMTARRFTHHRLALVSAIFLLLLLTVAVLAPLLAPYNPNQTNLQLAKFGQPAHPSLAHPMGSDQLGRDWLSRLIIGSRVTLIAGFLATGFAILVGTLLGAIAGYAGRGVDMLIMRLSDVFLAFPPLLFLMGALSGFKNRPVWLIALTIGVIGWMTVARLVRGEFLSLRRREYAEAARAIGARPTAIIFRHLLPNATSPIIVAASLGIPAAILTESTLSFLGFGIQPPTASWGDMLQIAYVQMRDSQAWWIGFYPGLMIALTVLAFNFVGDGLRDALDPRTWTR